MLSQDLVGQVVAGMLDGGAVSLKALRFKLEQRLGTSLHHRRADIKHFAQQYVAQREIGFVSRRCLLTSWPKCGIRMLGSGNHILLL